MNHFAFNHSFSSAKYLIPSTSKIIGIFVIAFSSAFSQKTIFFDIQKDVRKNHANVINRAITNLNERSYKGIRMNEDYEDGIVWLKNFEFRNGTIEFDTRGKDIKQHSFVGVAFHGTDTTTFECIYLRPFNFQAEEEFRRNRAVQYVAKPSNTWQVLRARFPGEYEHSIIPAPDPNAWVHMKITITDSAITTYINNDINPSLAVKPLGVFKTGSVGFYVADTSGGDFANLKITKTE